MSEQQIISQDEKKRKKLIKHQKFSKKSFIIFIISLVFYLYITIRYVYFDLIDDIFIGFLGELCYPLYIIYLILHSLFVVIVYKKILIYNLIAFALLFIIGTLNYTGFCYTRGHYLSKAEQIDIGLEGYLYAICFNDGYKGWENIKDCPHTLKKLKSEYPQCFTENRHDKCELYEYANNHPNGLMNRIYGNYPMSAVCSVKLGRLSNLVGSTCYSIFSSGSASYGYYYSYMLNRNFKTRSEK